MEFNVDENALGKPEPLREGGATKEGRGVLLLERGWSDKRW